jgi:hypothetical protein
VKEGKTLSSFGFPRNEEKKDETSTTLESAQTKLRVRNESFGDRRGESWKMREGERERFKGENCKHFESFFQRSSALCTAQKRVNRANDDI